MKVYSYVEKYAEFKNRSLKKIGWYIKLLCATEYPRGRHILKLALKWGTLYHRIQFDQPCNPKNNFSLVPNCSLKPPEREKKCSPKLKLIWAMQKCMVTMATSNVILTGWKCTYKFNHILADAYHRLLILVSN